VIARYKGNPNAAKILAEKIRKGGVGVWGQVPMPPNPPALVSDAEINTLVKWILAGAK